MACPESSLSVLTQIRQQLVYQFTQRVGFRSHSFHPSIGDSISKLSFALASY
jgi:hypothetical protein